MTDTLVISFQTRLSAVMETILKTTMYEITRLVEESFLEQMDRGKRESEVLKRRLIVSEAKLRERDRFKRVRCVDCGRTAVSRRRVTLLHRGPETQSSLDHPLVVKQENASDSSWRCSPKGNTNQEKLLTTLETLENAVQVGEQHKPGGEVKAFLVIHSQIHKQKDPQSSVEETNGFRNTDSDHKPGGTSCTEIPGDENEVRHRNPPKCFDPTKPYLSARSSVSQPEPVRTSVSSESPGLRPQSAGTEDRKLDCVLKDEALYVTAGHKELQDGWTLDTEGAEVTDFSAHGYIEQELQQIQEDWSSGLEQNADSDTYTNIVAVQGLPYRTRYDAEELASYGVHELDMGDGQGEKTQDTLGHAVSVAVGTDQKDLDIAEEGGRRYGPSIRSKRGNRGSLPAQRNPETEDVDRDMHCLFINADGHLQDTSALMEGRSGIAEGAGHRGHSLYAGDTASGSHYKGHALNHPLKSNVGQALGDRKDSVKGYQASHQVISSPAYTCNQCGKKFTQACNLKLHQRVHQREGLHLCNHCGKGYTSFSDLRKHRCSQTGDKPYTCMLCGNKFSRLWNLKLHQRIHTQEKPHKCTMCSKSFTRADILKVHQRTHTGERPYGCVIYGLSFKRMHHLRSHQRKHSADLNNQ